MDVSHRALEIARERLERNWLSSSQQSRLQLFQGSLIYRDERLAGYDAATLIEVIEHLDLNRLASMERVVFEFARPRTAIITTPNIEYNVRFELWQKEDCATGIIALSGPEQSFRPGQKRWESALVIRWSLVALEPTIPR